MTIDEKSVKKFDEKFGRLPEKYVTASGRINIIGEHVDYCGGLVLPASLSLKCKVYGALNGTDKLRMFLYSDENIRELSLDSLVDYRDMTYFNYQAGVAHTLIKGGYPLKGADLFFKCEVPFGSGLSSSAAIEVATAVMLNELSGNAYTLMDMALLAQKAENEYCNTKCGILDQFASAMGKKDSAILLDCNTLEYEYVPLVLDGYSIVVTDSNKRHSLADGDYNERRAESTAAYDLLKTVADIGCLADLSVEQFEKIKGVLPDKLRDRATHIVYECERVSQAVEALKCGDIVRLGSLLNESHESLSTLYDVTGREIDALAHIAQRQTGCLGSRMIGGGFGGCTISIVKDEYVKAFDENVEKEYESEIGYGPTVYDVSVEDGVTVEDI